MELNERKLRILQAIISDFIHSAEPVGSRTISRKYDMGVSPATIRNEMSDLEQMGFLTHPHTSAGRVPSAKAYRLYVDDLMERHELTDEAKQTIRQQLDTNIMEFDKAIEQATRILSEITNLISFAIAPTSEEERLKYVNILPANEDTVVMMIMAESGNLSNAMIKLRVPYTEEKLALLSKVITYNFRGKKLDDILRTDIIRSFETDIEALNRLAEFVMPSFLSTLEDILNVELYFDGLTNIFSIPEYNDMERAREMLSMVNRKKDFADILLQRDSGTIITIGDENDFESMHDCSLITATYRINGKLAGKLGVIGPTRMRYSEITSVIDYMTDYLNQAFQISDTEDT
ncbi:MAG TPA: heat-inducible transcription repressor HrcA [Clostridiales bacterium]|nr:heat-inducible transcription repressor HrcA [Clostridiales bacterium]